MFKEFFARVFRPRRRTSATAGARFSLDEPERPAADQAKPQAVAEWEAAATRRIDRHARPEELCGIHAGMTHEEIRAHLAALYRRHNRAAASLDATLREEAEIMLDAIVQCRERFLERHRPV